MKKLRDAADLAAQLRADLAAIPEGARAADLDEAIACYAAALERAARARRPRVPHLAIDLASGGAEVVRRVVTALDASYRAPAARVLAFVGAMTGLLGHPLPAPLSLPPEPEAQVRG